MYYACCYEREQIMARFVQLGADINTSVRQVIFVLLVSWKRLLLRLGIVYQ